MTFVLDPEVAAIIGPMLAPLAELPPVAVGDVATRRAMVAGLLTLNGTLLPVPDDVASRDLRATAADGTAIPLRWYTKHGVVPSSAVLYLHGGGMIAGSIELYDAMLRRYASATGVGFLSVEFRYAPEHPHPTAVEDCYAALQWLAEHAAELGIDPARIAVMGDSGGGGIAAGLALLTRDRGGPAPARQILVYPMLDDRTVEADPQLAPFAIWSYEDNRTGWDAVLGDARGGNEVSPYAAPARATDLGGLPQTYLEVAELDIYRDEVLTYARRLTAAGVSTELHMHPGVQHGFEVIAPTSAAAGRVFADRHRAIGSF